MLLILQKFYKVGRTTKTVIPLIQTLIVSQSHNILSFSTTNQRDTYWVRRVKAALVIDVGRLRPLVISLQIFLLITSTRPPFSVTSLYSLYRSSTCFAMMGMRFTGVPEEMGEYIK